MIQACQSELEKEPMRYRSKKVEMGMLHARDSESGEYPVLHRSTNAPQRAFATSDVMVHEPTTLCVVIILVDVSFSSFREGRVFDGQTI